MPHLHHCRANRCNGWAHSESARERSADRTSYLLEASPSFSLRCNRRLRIFGRLLIRSGYGHFNSHTGPRDPPTHDYGFLGAGVKLRDFYPSRVAAMLRGVAGSGWKSLESKGERIATRAI